MKVQEHMQKNKTRVAYVGIPTKRCPVPSMLRNSRYHGGETSIVFVLVVDPSNGASCQFLHGLLIARKWTSLKL